MKLHIVLFSDLFLSGGGCESWLYKFLQSADALFVFYDEIHIYGVITQNISEQKRISDIIHSDNIFFHYSDLKSLTVFQRIFNFFKYQKLLLKQYCYDGDHLVSIGSFYEMFAVYLFRGKRNLKKIVWLRTLLQRHLKSRRSKYILPIICALEKLCLHRMDCIIANGNDTKQFYEERYGLKNIVTIPNAIICNTVKANLLAFTNKKIKIAFVGRLCKDKGFRQFCDSIELFNADPISDIEFVIIGNGNMKNIAIRLSEQYINCTFLGSVDNNKIYDYLNTVDATVNLNFVSVGGAGVSNSLLESLFAGNLLICWNNKIFSQVVDETTAIMVPENDVQKLADTYKFIAANPDLCKHIIENTSHLKKRYDFSTHMKAFLDVVKMLE